VITERLGKKPDDGTRCQGCDARHEPLNVLEVGPQAGATVAVLRLCVHCRSELQRVVCAEAPTYRLPHP
jgi:hypothetical protein